MANKARLLYADNYLNIVVAVMLVGSRTAVAVIVYGHVDDVDLPLIARLHCYCYY